MVERDLAHPMITRLGKGLQKAYKSTPARSVSEFCSASGVGYSWMQDIIRSESEPKWMQYLRAVKRTSGLSWEDILGR